MSERSWKLDAVRGAAVLLMVLDHVLHVGVTFHGWPASLYLLRLSVTRLALPAFMIVAGYLWAYRGVSVRRVRDLIAAAAISAVLCWLISIPLPEVLLCYLLGLALSPMILRRPLLFIVGGFLWAFNFSDRLPVWAYQPAYVVAWASLGVLLCQATGWYVEEAPRRPWANPLIALGQRPLALYVFHLAVLAAWAYTA